MPRPVIAINMDFSDVDQKKKCEIPSAYPCSIHEAGGLPLLIPSIPDKTLFRQYLRKVQGVVFIGGKDYPAHYFGQSRHPKAKLQHPQRAASDWMLANMVLKQTCLPVLGICAGHQLVNIVMGGKLVQHLRTADAHTGMAYHAIRITGGSILKRIFGRQRLTVNSTHHQAVDPNHVGFGLQAVAKADDGIVEAMEGIGSRYVLTVQWHPEKIKYREHRQRLFKAFVRAAARFDQVPV